jgi:hypothetical protein
MKNIELLICDLYLELDRVCEYTGQPISIKLKLEIVDRIIELEKLVK